MTMEGTAFRRGNPKRCLRADQKSRKRHGPQVMPLFYLSEQFPESRLPLYSPNPVTVPMNTGRFVAESTII